MSIYCKYSMSFCDMFF
uniref:Uncharacterized protein n=1 Tax=Anguilla anguilla TaxID=7936 RepID=A0A0E9RXY2_ANGAN